MKVLVKKKRQDATETEELLKKSIVNRKALVDDQLLPGESYQIPMKHSCRCKNSPLSSPSSGIFQYFPVLNYL